MEENLLSAAVAALARWRRRSSSAAAAAASSAAEGGGAAPRKKPRRSNKKLFGNIARLEENYPLKTRFGFTNSTRGAGPGVLRVGTVLKVNGNLYGGYPEHETFIEVTNLGATIKGRELRRIGYPQQQGESRATYEEESPYTFGGPKVQRRLGYNRYGPNDPKQITRHRNFVFAGYADGSERVRFTSSRMSEHFLRHH